MEMTNGLIARSFLWKLVERVGQQAVSFVITVTLARLLLPEEYGLIALIMVFVNICSVIVDGGFATALVQKKGATDDDFSSVLIFSVGMSGLLYGALWLAAPLLARFYGMEDIVPVARVLGLSIFGFSVSAVQRAFVAKRMLFRKLFLSSVGASIGSGIVGIQMAFKGYGVWALVAQNLTYHCLSCLILGVSIGWRPRLVFAYQSFKGLFDFGWKIFIASLVTVVFVEIRKLLIGKGYSSSELAYYERGDQLPSLVMNNLFVSIQAVMLPVFSEYQHDKEKVKSMMRRSTKLSCFVIYPLMAGLSATAEPLVKLLLTDKWIAAVPFIQILSIANFFKPITISNWEAIKALGHSGITLKLELLKKILDVLILMATFYYGVYAIAWGLVFHNFLCLFINLYPNKRLLNYGIGEQIRDAVPTLILALVMGGVVWSVRLIGLSTLGCLALQILVGIVVYIGLSWVCKEESLYYLLAVLKKARGHHLNER